MRAQQVKFSSITGKIISRKSVEVFFASSSDPPTIEITLSDNPVYTQQIWISPKQLLNLIFSRMIEKLK
jgi:hypothetical protein